MTREPWRWMGGAAAFCLAAVLNCGGYRYGVGDQAFYIPAIVQRLDPRLFPRDRFLLHAQDRLMVFDDLAAFVSRMLHVSLPALFLAGYFIAMLLLFGATLAIGRRLYRSSLSVAALVVLLTLRHRITQTGANTLEAYFHPRMLAFALGLWAMAACLRARAGLAMLLTGLAFAMHPTTGLWFGVWIGSALMISYPRWRAPLAVAALMAGAVAIWAIAFGPLQGRLARIDPTWASVMAGKDYIFPSDWGPAFWIINFGYLLVIAAIFRMRQQRRLIVAGETGMVGGTGALVVLFLISWPLMTMGVALAVQLQTSRIFWIVDTVTAIYLAWLIAEAMPARAARMAVAALAIIAIGRGIYVTAVEHRGDPVIAFRLPHDNWSDAMEWIAKTPVTTHVLADPGHAWKFGSSVRAAGERDVLVEEVKDSAVALYSRDAAMWVLGRLQDVQHFDSMTPDQFHGLATRYDLDLLVIDRDVELPLAYKNQQFRIYQLKHSSGR